MITAKNITRKQAQRLVKLLNQWTRCEIMARFGPFKSLEFGDYAAKKIEIEDKIRQMLYKEANLHELGIKWKIIKRKKRKSRMD